MEFAQSGFRPFGPQVDSLRAMEDIFRLPELHKLLSMFLQRLRQTIHDDNRRAKSHVVHAIPTGSSRARIDDLTDMKRISRGRRHPPEPPMPRIVAANLLAHSRRNLCLQPRFQKRASTRSPPLRATDVPSKLELRSQYGKTRATTLTSSSRSLTSTSHPVKTPVRQASTVSSDPHQSEC